MLGRLLFLVAFSAVAAAQPVATPPVEAPPGAAPADAGGVEADFQAWLAQFRAEQAARGVAPAALDAVLGGLHYSPRVVELDRAQPDDSGRVALFSDYLAKRVEPVRIGRGRVVRDAVEPLLAANEAATGVPGTVVLGIWGMESSYGAVTGTFDVPRSLATLAFDGRRRALFSGELAATVDMVARGLVPRERLTGSWAGAMGQPQFLPSSYLKYARDGDGDGRADIWDFAPRHRPVDRHLPPRHRLAARAGVGHGRGAAARIRPRPRPQPGPADDLRAGARQAQPVDPGARVEGAGAGNGRGMAGRRHAGDAGRTRRAGRRRLSDVRQFPRAARRTTAPISTRCRSGCSAMRCASPRPVIPAHAGTHLPRPAVCDAPVSRNRSARPLTVGRWVPAFAGMTIVSLLAACASHAPSPPGAAAPPRRVAAPAATTTGRVKIGQPYFVMGRWYTPADDPRYDETGIASWYGPGFHALATASGERYDQDGISAAHKTLPLPCFVEVTNLDNGRVLTVRVNDRGPFVDGRIIDLSRRSAQLLGVDGPGTARVRVRRVYPDAAQIAALTPPPAPPPPAPAAEPPPVPVAAPAVLAGDVFIQVAAVSDQGRAEWLKGYLASFAPTVTEKSPAGLWRVRLGPFTSAEAANPVLARVQAAGYTDARTVVAVPGR